MRIVREYKIVTQSERTDRDGGTILVFTAEGEKGVGPPGKGVTALPDGPLLEVKSVLEHKDGSVLVTAEIREDNLSFAARQNAMNWTHLRFESEPVPESERKSPMQSAGEVIDEAAKAAESLYSKIKWGLILYLGYKAFIEKK